jgi:hypothetical protein
LKITEVAKNFGATFFHGKSYLLILTKNGLGDIWGQFYQKIIWSS